MEIKNKKLFLAMRDLFYGGEFSHWFDKQSLPHAVIKEYEQAEKYFLEETGFKYPQEEEK